MKGLDMAGLTERLRSWAGKYRYVLLVILAGVVLLLLPTGGKEQESGTAETAAVSAQALDTGALEEKLERALSRVRGAGEVDVVLSVEAGPRQIWAMDRKREQEADAVREEESAVILSRGSGQEETVPVQQISPRFRGALVVCSGGDDPSVRLAMTEAVSAITGLSTDKISICKGK